MTTPSVVFEEPLRRTQSLGDVLHGAHAGPRGSTYNHHHRRSESQVPTSLNMAHRQEHYVDFERTTPPPVTIRVPPEVRPRMLTSTRWPEPPQIDDPPTPTGIQEDRGAANEQTGWIHRISVLLGYAGPNARARREVVTLMWNLSTGISQFVAIIALLAFSAHHESPTMPGLSEWKACERPLGVWDSIWVVRVALGLVMSVWTYRRDRTIRLTSQGERRRDALDPEFGATTFGPDRPYTATRAAPNRVYQSNTGSNFNTVTSRQDLESRNAEATANIPYSHAFARLSFIGSFITLAWFVTAHILEYTSVNSCRFAAPHLWWTTFAILCILYLTILEIFFLGLLVFILGPVIYLFWNIALLCLGRHPIQNPFYIKPEIGKLPKTVVDQIPLVLYIPPPPDDPDSGAFNTTLKAASPTKPSPVHSYPPPNPTRPPPKRRFAFLRKIGKGKSGSNGSDAKKSKGRGKNTSEEVTWEDTWEQGEYPFVRLEGNRAACAICLMDFEEPRKVGEPEKTAEERSAAAGDGGGSAQEVEVGEVTQEERDEYRLDELRLDDAGEGPQPLRLLACGHVFHKTCVDPWLTDVSGRCPVCQRPVELPDPPGKKSKRSQRRT